MTVGYRDEMKGCIMCGSDPECVRGKQGKQEVAKPRRDANIKWRARKKEWEGEDDERFMHSREWTGSVVSAKRHAYLFAGACKR